MYPWFQPQVSFSGDELLDLAGYYSVKILCAWFQPMGFLVVVMQVNVGDLAVVGRDFSFLGWWFGTEDGGSADVGMWVAIGVVGGSLLIMLMFYGQFSYNIDTCMEFELGVGVGISWTTVVSGSVMLTIRFPFSLFMGCGTCMIFIHFGTKEVGVTGHLVKDGNKLPLTIAHWTQMPAMFVLNAILEVKKIFDYPDDLNDWFRAKLNDRWRNYGHFVKKEGFRKYTTQEERLAHRPKYVVESRWGPLVEYWHNPHLEVSFEIVKHF
ncbi:hypothetical protein MKW98_031380 [Papaver atlanticum]|uniref:Uncharacterized protein n=1 Tax=Papaver atlanticum TaxID=357466 RepID=A0AAD4S4Z1_9MAGN|nr:hypothetical protein MKW98_031380 [Papaver atlanticum]